MKSNNPWMEHLKEIKKQNPKLSLKERMKLAKATYKKESRKEIKNKYVTQEQFEKLRDNNTINFFLCFGLIFVIPVLYSIASNQKNYLVFYGMLFFGIIVTALGIIQCFQWRKKYVKKEMV